MQNTKKKKKRILESEKPKKGDVQVVKTGRQKKKKNAQTEAQRQAGIQKKKKKIC